MNKKSILKMRDVSKYYKNELIFKNVNFELKKGDVISIVGKSGCGKSTMLKCINKLEEINSGEIMFNGVNIKTGEEGYNTVYKIPFRIIAGSHVKLKLEGENSLIHATTTSGSNCILVGEEYKSQASLYIYGDGKLNLSSGSLDTSLGGAAIESHNSPLTIAGGTINVQKGVIQNTMSNDDSNAIINMYRRHKL